MGGEPHTFWLFTKDGRSVKGEGPTDAHALDEIRAKIRILTGEAPTPTPADDLWRQQIALLREENRRLTARVAEADLVIAGNRNQERADQHRIAALELAEKDLRASLKNKEAYYKSRIAVVGAWHERARKLCEVLKTVRTLVAPAGSRLRDAGYQHVAEGLSAATQIIDAALTSDAFQDVVAQQTELHRLREEVAALGTRLVKNGQEMTCCGPAYVRRGPDGKRISTTITLNEYQRTNLLWLLCDVAGYDRQEPLVKGLNTGDWNGEIPNALRTYEDGRHTLEEPEQRPNAGPDHVVAWDLREEIEALGKMRASAAAECNQTAREMEATVQRLNAERVQAEQGFTKRLVALQKALGVLDVEAAALRSKTKAADDLMVLAKFFFDELRKHPHGSHEYVTALNGFEEAVANFNRYSSARSDSFGIERMDPDEVLDVPERPDLWASFAPEGHPDGIIGDLGKDPHGAHTKWEPYVTHESFRRVVAERDCLQAQLDEQCRRNGFLVGQMAAQTKGAAQKVEALEGDMEAMAQSGDRTFKAVKELRVEVNHLRDQLTAARAGEASLREVLDQLERAAKNYLADGGVHVPVMDYEARAKEWLDEAFRSFKSVLRAEDAPSLAALLRTTANAARTEGIDIGRREERDAHARAAEPIAEWPVGRLRELAERRASFDAYDVAHLAEAAWRVRVRSYVRHNGAEPTDSADVRGELVEVLKKVDTVMRSPSASLASLHDELRVELNAARLGEEAMREALEQLEQAVHNYLTEGGRHTTVGGTGLRGELIEASKKAAAIRESPSVTVTPVGAEVAVDPNPWGVWFEPKAGNSFNGYWLTISDGAPDAIRFRTRLEAAMRAAEEQAKTLAKTLSWTPMPRLIRQDVALLSTLRDAVDWLRDVASAEPEAPRSPFFREAADDIEKRSVRRPA